MVLVQEIACNIIDSHRYHKHLVSEQNYFKIIIHFHYAIK